MISERLATEGRLRPGMRSDEAKNVAWALTSPHQYEYLVIERGRKVERYRAHVEAAITSLLFREDRHREVQSPTG